MPPDASTSHVQTRQLPVPTAVRSATSASLAVIPAGFAGSPHSSNGLSEIETSTEKLPELLYQPSPSTVPRKSRVAPAGTMNDCCSPLNRPALLSDVRPSPTKNIWPIPGANHAKPSPD